MTAPAGSSRVRLRLIRALEDFLANHTQDEIAGEVGCSRSSISRRDADPKAWGWDLVELAVRYPDLQRPLVDYVRGEQEPAGSPVRAMSSAFDALEQAGHGMGEISAAVQDGRIDPTEAEALTQTLQGVVEAATNLLLDVRSIVEGAR